MAKSLSEALKVKVDRFSSGSTIPLYGNELALVQTRLIIHDEEKARIEAAGQALEKRVTASSVEETKS